MVAASGSAGMNRKQIDNAVDLDRDIVDQLLAGLVGIGLLTVALEFGVPVYRAGRYGGDRHLVYSKNEGDKNFTAAFFPYISFQRDT